MGTKQLGWPAAGLLAVRCLALTLSVTTVVVTLAAGAAHAADPKKARDKIVELNKQALLSYEAKDFETARDLLTKALKEAKGAGLEDDKMTARTYLHLGAVYWVGFQDQAVALQNFSLAKKIRPDIQLTPSIETADLKSVFDMATVEAEPTPPPQPTRPVTAPTPSRPQPRATTPMLGDDSGEPALPPASAFGSGTLLCSTPQDAVPPNKELTIRCALKPGLRANMVQIHYRAPDVEAFQSLGMRKTAKGWYLVVLPASIMKQGTLQVYFDARDSGDNEIASNGQVDSPSTIEIRKKGSGGGGVGKEEDPMKKIKEQEERRKYEATLHRRREGAFWFAVGGGAGWGFSPAGNLEWRKSIKVSALTAPVGLFHIVPEVGYMWTDDFALAGQVIYESIKQEQLQLQGETGPTISGSPSTAGFGALGRAIFYTDLGSGNFRLMYSADIGGGFLRVPVKPHASPKMVLSDPTDPSSNQIHDPAGTIYKTDTRPIGPFLVGISGGFIYHIHRHFALTFEGKFMTGLPNFGAVFQGIMSAQLALGGAKGPEKQPGDEEEENEGETGVINDEPPPVDDSSASEESEE